MIAVEHGEPSSLCLIGHDIFTRAGAGGAVAINNKPPAVRIALVGSDVGHDLALADVPIIDVVSKGNVSKHD